MWAGLLLLLVAVTYRLWMSQGDIPIVSMVSLPKWLSTTLSVASLSTLVGSLLIILVGYRRASPRVVRGCWWVVAGSLMVAFVVDQHRLQPWAYQSTLYAILFATLPAAELRKWIVPLAISIYVYSGLGKLDYQFAHSVGQDLVNVITGTFGGLPEGMSDAMRARLALMLPAVECLVGFSLIFGRLRRVSGVMIIAMHVTLIATLGPWGLQHSLGVLCWNFALLAQAWLLFVRPVRDDKSETRSKNRQLFRRSRHSQRWGASGWLARGCVLFAILVPLSERKGYWDHWTSWALYAPHNSRVDVDVHKTALKNLDPTVKLFLQEDEDGDGWQRLSLGQWSLDSLGVPVYPQSRYQLGLACELTRRDGLDDGIRARLKGVADRFTGVREERFLIGRRELEEARKPFWLLPRHD